MARTIEKDFIGIRDVSSHFTRCQACNRLTWLSSYSTRQFAILFNTAVFPLKKIRVMDQCPICGHRAANPYRLYAKGRKKNEAIMMDGFVTDPDNPDNCCQALRTLMIYDEEAWFLDVEKSYGPRFEADPRVQYTIAQGLCRFGYYENAIERCRAAIELEAGPGAEELLNSCLDLQEASALDDQSKDIIVQPKSVAKAYVPLVGAGLIAVAFILIHSLTAIQGPNAWIVNGSLRPYSISLDDKTYSLPVGQGEIIKLSSGPHDLHFENTLLTNFTYSSHPLKRLFKKELVVINPDEMALLTSQRPLSRRVRYMHGSILHKISGISLKNKKRNKLKGIKGIDLIRLDTDQAMVDRFIALGEEKHAQLHALKSVKFTPESPEAETLLYIALKNKSADFIHSFLKPHLARSPMQLAYHKYYQDDVKMNNPDKDLVPEYKTRCEQHPDEPESLYLLARVIDTPSIARGFFEASENGHGMHGLGFHAISRSYFARGDYENALKYTKYAMRADPDNAYFITLKKYALLATHNYAELVKISGTNTPAMDRVLYLTLDGYHHEAEKLANQYKADSKEKSARLNAVRYHAVGNIDAYLNYNTQSGDPDATFINLIFQNAISSADSELPSVENAAWWQHLVLYCAAMNSEQNSIAEKNLEIAISKLSEFSLEKIKLIRLLSTTKPPQLKAIMEPECKSVERALTCLVLSHRFPKHEKEYKDLAKHLNFYPIYPYLLIKRWSETNTPDQ